MMNVYEFDIWYQVKHDGKFSHTVTRTQLVHALNLERARRKITLKPAVSRSIGPLEVEASDEFIYAVKRTGTVIKRMFYVYSDGRRPIMFNP